MRLLNRTAQPIFTSLVWKCREPCKTHCWCPASRLEPTHRSHSPQSSGPTKSKAWFPRQPASDWITPERCSQQNGNFKTQLKSVGLKERYTQQTGRRGWGQREWGVKTLRSSRGHEQENLYLEIESHIHVCAYCELHLTCFSWSLTSGGGEGGQGLKTFVHYCTTQGVLGASHRELPS